MVKVFQEPKIFFIQHKDGSMCGASALIHSLVSGNNHLELEDGPLKEFLDQAGDLEPAERGQLLVNNEGLAGIYDEAGAEQETLHHIICFVRVGDQVKYRYVVQRL